MTTVVDARSALPVPGARFGTIRWPMGMSPLPITLSVERKNRVVEGSPTFT
jgi:hypothetical protein